MALASACIASTCGGRLYLCVVAQPSCCVVCVRCMPLGVDSHQPQQECTDAVPYVWVRYTVLYTGTVQSITDACLPTGFMLFVCRAAGERLQLAEERTSHCNPPAAICLWPHPPGLPPNPRENTHTRARAHACTPNTHTRAHTHAAPPPSPQTHKHQRAYARHICICLCVRAHRTMRACGRARGRCSSSSRFSSSSTSH